MSENEPNKGYGNFIPGIPCKFSEIAIIPKHIYEYFNEGEIAKCRGGELVTLELIKEYSNEGLDKNARNSAISADLSAMYGMGIKEYTSRWEKRVDALKMREGGWVKVMMHKVDNR